MQAAKAAAQATSEPSKSPDAATMSKGIVTPTATADAVQAGKDKMDAQAAAPSPVSTLLRTGTTDPNLPDSPFVQSVKPILGAASTAASRIGNILTTGTPTGTPGANLWPGTSVPYTPPATAQPVSAPVVATPQQTASAPALPKDGQVTTKLPGGGSVTFGKPTAEQMARQHLDDLATNKAVMAIDKAIANGTDMKGERIKDENEFGEKSFRQTDPVAQKAIASGVYNPNAKGTINGLPASTANEKLAQDMKSRGILNPGSNAYAINEQVNQAIRDGRSFGNLLGQYDRASNRSPVTADPNVVANPDGTTFNKVTGETMTNAAAAPKETPMQKLLSTPTNTPEEARENARQRAAERLSVRNTAEVAMQQGEAGTVGRRENYLNGISNSSDPNIVADEKRRSAQYAAKQALERASADRPNGDPLRDAQIAVNQAEAAKQMAMANGATEEQIQKNPGMVSRYLTNPNGINALGSTEKTNQLAMEHLRGADMRDLVKNAVDRNIGGSQVAEFQNKRAVDQNSKQATIAERGDKAADRETALKIQAQNALDRKEEKATQTRNDRVKGLEGRLDRVDKEIAENEKDSGDVTKKAGALRNLDAQRKKKAATQAELDEALGLKPEKVDSETAAGNNTPQPNQTPATKTINGIKYVQKDGKWFKA